MSGPTRPTGAGACPPDTGTLHRSSGERADEAFARALVGRCIPLREEEQINVRTVIQFLAAQLAQRQHRETVKRQIQARRHVVGRGADQTVGQQR